MMDRCTCPYAALHDRYNADCPEWRGQTGAQ